MRVVLQPDSGLQLLLVRHNLKVVLPEKEHRHLKLKRKHGPHLRFHTNPPLQQGALRVKRQNPPPLTGAATAPIIVDDDDWMETT